MLFVLMVASIGGHQLKKRDHRWLQEAGLTTIIGLAAGLVLLIFNGSLEMFNLNKHFSNLFMLLLLPPIIFESGYNMQKVLTLL
jgi:hypothetical protein